jgi:uncharacterized protein YkuJ
MYHISDTGRNHMANKQWVREMRLVAETPDHNFTRSDIHMIDRICEALGKVQNVKIGVAFFDENGNRIRKVEFHEGSETFKLMVEEELGTDDTAAVGA